MKTIEEQIEDIIIAWFKSGNENSTYLAHQIFEVCKRYAIEVAKASLEKASENADWEMVGNEFDSRVAIIRSSITSEDNIVL